MFDELHKGNTRFSLKISDSCDICYNVRLLKVTTLWRVKLTVLEHPCCYAVKSPHVKKKAE